ncbi:hypothetical protein ACFFMP_06405 [Pseudoroseomonas cervicalis]
MARPAEAAHLAAFWPEHRPAPVARAALLALPQGAVPPPRLAGQLLRYAPGVLRSPDFAGRRRAVALLPLEGLPPILADAPLAPRRPMPRPWPAPPPPPPMPRRRDRRRAGAARPRRRPAAPAAARGAGARPLPAGAAGGGARAGRRPPPPPPAAAAGARPGRPADAAPLLSGEPGLRQLRARLSPWTLLDLAEDLYGATPEMALLAAAAGVRVAGRALDPAPGWAALIAATRCADPFLSRPCSFEDSLRQLAEWARAQAENRRVAICLGMAFWKRRRIAALFAHAGGAPGFTRSAGHAIAEAKRQGGAVAAWAGAMPQGFREACGRAGVTLLTVEDGFVRSRGLGARFLPGAAYAVDAEGIYYDPARPSGLERLLAESDFPPDLLARAAALRQAIVARGVTKYNLAGSAPRLDPPPGRDCLLVPGQVEDDASVRLGGAGLGGNLDLLRAVRAANPDAWIVYKPHPDLEAGFRKGRLPPEALAGLADQVVTGAPLTALLPQIDALHTLTSLSGFEALLRGVKVVTWGQPFYAGWGLTEDRAPPPRRGRTLELDALVAGALILFPRQVDPLTELPCPPELVLERLQRPELWKISPLTLHRGVEGWLRGLLARRRGLR